MRHAARWRSCALAVAVSCGTGGCASAPVASSPPLDCLSLEELDRLAEILPWCPPSAESCTREQMDGEWLGQRIVNATADCRAHNEGLGLPAGEVPEE